MTVPNTRPLGYHHGKRVVELSRQKRSTARHKPPAGETKRDRFIRLLNARMKNTLTCIRLIGNLANKDVYKYEDEDIASVRETILAALNEATSQFAPVRREVIKFELPARENTA